ncbi:MAG TPA: SusC/RagA family TonB-linked outer membrane protein, partial [Paludibacter sp.]|nr:SusC/RagA family TonB-linked outer membrane protein [Paludibacter sp.]
MKQTTILGKAAKVPLSLSINRTFRFLSVLLFGIIFSAATSLSAQDAQISINARNTTVREVLKMIEAKSEYHFAYNNKLIDVTRKVDVIAVNEKISDILKKIFANTDVTYKVLDSQIILASAKEMGEAVEKASFDKVSGKVTDEAGQSLPGVSVLVKGTKQATITDVNGSYLINNLPKNATLQFSFIGMLTREAKVGSQSVINISLQDESKGLSEVVVVGYGVTTKKGLVSAVTSIKSDDLNKGAITDVGQLLQGKAAGLNITVSGDPTRKSSVILRGASTLNSSMEPFYVIDGIPGGDISLVAPDDIETIDILKDASATSIYGNRASNGVIMVTTKKGKKGVTHVSYNGYAGIENVSNSLKMMNAAQVRAFTTKTGQNLTEDTGADTDWQKEIQRGTAYSTNHNLSFNGGSEHNTYSASINYTNKQGIIKESNQNKIVARLTFDQMAFNDKVKFGVSVANARVISDYVPQLGAVLLQAANRLPTSPVKNVDGTYYENLTKNGYFNPAAIVNYGQDQTKNNNLMASFTTNVKLPWGFTYDLSISYQNYNSLHGEYYDSYLERYNSSVFYNNPEPPATKSIVIFGTGGTGLRNNYQTTNQVLENWLTWNKKIGLHSVNAVLGYSHQDDVYGDGFQATNINFPVNSMGFNNLALGDYYTYRNNYKINFGWDQAYSKQRLISYFGRLNYNFNDKYYLQASIRRDGSSVFGKNNQWGYFPSIGLSWRAGQEQFIQDLNIFEDLKVRASYGVTGNSTGFNAYTAQSLSSSMANFYYNGNSVMAYGPNKAENSDLRWEKTATANIGIDASVLKGRLSFTVDLYNKNTTDMIYWYDADILLVPAGGLNANGGSMNNKGIELSVTAVPVKTRDFTWKTSVNLAHNKNTITSLSNPYFAGGDSIRYTQPDGGSQTSSTLQIRQKGYPLGQFFTLSYQGKDDKGVSQYLAKDGKLTTNPTTADYRYAGSPQPKLNYGWSNTFTYKNFDLSVFFRGVYGNKIFNATRADLFRPTSLAFTNILVDAGNEGNDKNAYKYSSRFVEDGSYLRLENMTLGYTFKSPVKYIENLRLYGTVNNLFVITKYTGVDPEVNQGGMAPGIDS